MISRTVSVIRTDATLKMAYRYGLTKAPPVAVNHDNMMILCADFAIGVFADYTLGQVLHNTIRSTVTM